jgi:hypothetical protein
MPDEEWYQAAPVKILLILKEVNDTGQGFDLRDFLRAGGRPQTWDNVTRWVEGIFGQITGEDVLPWEHFELIGKERRAKALRQVCAVNLKKAGGIHTTSNGELEAATASDAARMRSQFSLYRADLTICCGSAVTASVQHHQLLGGQLADGTWKRTRRGVRYHPVGQHGVVIDYSHPAARISPNLLLYGLLDAVAEIRARGGE